MLRVNSSTRHSLLVQSSLSRRHHSGSSPVYVCVRSRSGVSGDISVVRDWGSSRSISTLAIRTGSLVLHTFGHNEVVVRARAACRVTHALPPSSVVGQVASFASSTAKEPKPTTPKTTTLKPRTGRRKPIKIKGVAATVDEADAEAAMLNEYSRQTPREHVLLRPQMYVGSTERTPLVQTSITTSTDSASSATTVEGGARGGGLGGFGLSSRSWDFVGGRLVPLPPGSYDLTACSPALGKIFDEVLVNAADQSVRDSTMTKIDVTIDPVEPRITVTNDGVGVPVAMHPTEDVYIPELIFGNLLTGSNFDDTKGRLTGGRHGYGAKLTNILSSEFKVTTADAQRGLVYSQIWSSNMRDKQEPVIKPFENTNAAIKKANIESGGTGAVGARKRRGSGKAGGGGFTTVSFVPDLDRLGYDGDEKKKKKKKRIGDGDLSALRRRVVDVAGCLGKHGIRVSLNGESLDHVRSLQDYITLFTADGGAEDASDDDDGDFVDDDSADDASDRLSGDAASASEKKKKHRAKKMAATELGGGGRWEVGVLPTSAIKPLILNDDDDSNGGKGGTNDSKKTSSSIRRHRQWMGAGHVSFVNGLATPRGGTHVNAVTTPLVKALAEELNKKHNSVRKAGSSLSGSNIITPALVKQHLVVFINCQIENPTFDSQSKDFLTTKASAFKSISSEATPYQPSKAFVKRVLETTSLEADVVATAELRLSAQLNHELELLSKAGGGSSSSSTRNRRQRLNIDKLEDARLAEVHGGRGSRSEKGVSKCTLILTEGDSAKALAVAGLESVGRDFYGVFPLRGKLRNVRELSKAKLLGNKELMDLCAILGLSFDKTYPNGPDHTLRYSKVLIMADQDHDGSHIKGLLVNFFHQFWPNLVRSDSGFLQQFATPIIKATRLKSTIESTENISNGDAVKMKNEGKKGEVLSFFSTEAFERWRRNLEQEHENGHLQVDVGGGKSDASSMAKKKDEKQRQQQRWQKEWRVKYYKGLGTSTAAEAREYFSNLDSHRSTFVWNGEGLGLGEVPRVTTNETNDFSGDTSDVSNIDDVPNNEEEKYRDADDLVDLVFSKSRAEDRKKWLERHSKPEPLPTGQAQVSVCDFVNRELVNFSHADNRRSIPSVIDGLKPSQRKVLFACLKRESSSSSNDEVKVAQLAGYCSEHTAYHHGEASLQATIVGMAQDFVGCSNNLPLLKASGMFGTRSRGGDDAAQARYIFTKLMPVTRKLFPPSDDALLAFEVDDGMTVEPTHYCPTIPLVLANGAQGIGTGWSTFIPPFHPRALVAALQNKLKHSICFHDVTANPGLTTPWYRGFTGMITPFDNTTAAGNNKSDMIRSGAGRFLTRGVAKLHGDGVTVEVTELPIGLWTDTYKDVQTKGTSSGGSSSGSKKKTRRGSESGSGSASRSDGSSFKYLRKFEESGDIVGYEDYHTAEQPRFMITLPSKKKLKNLFEKYELQSHGDDRDSDDKENAVLCNFLGLETTVATSNMVCYRADGVTLKRYSSAAEIMDDYFPSRLALYSTRKDVSVHAMERTMDKLKMKEAFVDAVRSRAIDVASGQLTARDVAIKLSGVISSISTLPNDADFEQGIEDRSFELSFEQVELEAKKLLALPLSALTTEKIEIAKRERVKLEAELNSLKCKTPTDLWLHDLQELDDGLATDELLSHGHYTK